MRLLQLLMIAFISSGLSLHQAAAQQPDIVGTWSTKADILLETNDKVVKVPRELSILIEKMDGQYFTGSRSWKALTNAPGYVDDAKLLAASEPFIGAVAADGVTLRFVETDDRGLMFGKLLGPDRLEFTYMESFPHAVIFTVIMVRKPGG